MQFHRSRFLEKSVISGDAKTFQFYILMPANAGFPAGNFYLLLRRIHAFQGGQQQTPSSSAAHNHPVFLRVQFFHAFHRFRFPQNVHGNGQFLQLLRSYRGKTGIIQPGLNRIPDNFLCQTGLGGLNGANTASQLSVFSR